MTTTSFYEKCKGIALIIFATAALMYSIRPAQADAPQTMYATGKYQMAITSMMRSDNSSLWYILVWDSETGRSKFYYGSVDKGTNAAYSKFQLPSSPL